MLSKKYNLKLIKTGFLLKDLIQDLDLNSNTLSTGELKMCPCKMKVSARPSKVQVSARPTEVQVGARSSEINVMICLS